jgi:hypothetical protein
MKKLIVLQWRTDTVNAAQVSALGKLIITHFKLPKDILLKYKKLMKIS